MVLTIQEIKTKLQIELDAIPNKAFYQYFSIISHGDLVVSM